MCKWKNHKTDVDVRLDVCWCTNGISEEPLRSWRAPTPAFRLFCEAKFAPQNLHGGRFNKGKKCDEVFESLYQLGMLNQRVNTDDDFQIHLVRTEPEKHWFLALRSEYMRISSEPNFDVVVTFLVVPVATRLFVGGRSKRLLRLSIDDGLLTCQNGLASRSVVDLRPMDGFLFRQRESFVHTVMSRYMSE